MPLGTTSVPLMKRSSLRSGFATLREVAVLSWPYIAIILYFLVGS